MSTSTSTANKPKLIFFEANIGAGKSTLVEKLQRCTDVQVILEPVDVWKQTTDSKDKNILDYFYTDSKKYGYLFQSFAFLSRVNKLYDIRQDVKYVFVERSIFSDKNIFAENCYQHGMMDEIEWVIYNEWFKWADRTIGNYNHGFVYLECPPEECFRRIKERSRTEESTVELSYLQQLDDRHEEWFAKEERPVLRLNSLQNYRDDESVFDDFVEKITEFAENM